MKFRVFKQAIEESDGCLYSIEIQKHEGDWHKVEAVNILLDREESSIFCLDNEYEEYKHIQALFTNIENAKTIATHLIDYYQKRKPWLICFESEEI